MGEQTASVFLIRLAPAGESRVGYFINLPHGRSVTVNGITYTHSIDPPYSTFYIGPLEGYAVIELLSQPVFFFRDQASLKHTATVRSATQDEISRRDQHGDVPVEDTRVKWKLISDEMLDIEEEDAPVDPGSKDVPAGPGSDDASTELGDDDVPTGPEDGVSTVPESDDVSTVPGSDDLPTGPGDGDVPTGPEGDDIPTSSPPSSSELLASGSTEEETLLEDPYRYMGLTLPSNQQRHQWATLVPTVIASINYRYPRGSGFSTNLVEFMPRPGRTLIAYLEHEHSYYLLGARLDSNRNMSLKIVNPMAWKATREDRKAIYQAARQLLLASEWWRHAFDSAEDMEKAMPESAEWVPCAQAPIKEASYIYTVLNGWALAMGLEPNPAFTPSEQYHEAFFIQAQWLFDLAYQDALNWKLVFAFFRWTRFVKWPEEMYFELLPKRKRFDQVRRSFQDLCAREAKHSAKERNQKVDVDYLQLKLEAGLAHDEAFAWDALTDVEQGQVVHLVRRGQWSLRDTADQLCERIEQRKRKTSSPKGPGAGEPDSEGSDADSGLSEFDIFGPEIPESGIPESGISDSGIPEFEIPDSEISDAGGSDADSGISDSKLSGLEIPESEISESDISDAESGIPESELFGPGPDEEAWKPCEHLRQTLDRLLADAKIVQELRQLRSAGSLTTELGRWLREDEVAISIDAVLMAINNIQGMEEGFTIAPQWIVTDPGVPGVYLIRPGRPWIAPYIFGSHIVLLVMQLEENGRPAIYILDSLYHLHNQAERKHVFDHAWSVLHESDWCLDHFASPEAFSKLKPKSAIRVRTAMQPSSDECGYYTILNAWGLALGLELNPDVRLKWTDEFFQTLQNIMHLSLLGHADWQLIYAFLKCHDIVRKGLVPKNRRFSNTHAIRNESALGDDLTSARKQERIYRENNPLDRTAQQTNRIPNLHGRPHHEVLRCDSWSEDTRFNLVPRLQRLGLLNVDHTDSQVRQAWDQTVDYIFDGFLGVIPETHGQPHMASRVVQTFREYMTENYSTAQVRKDPVEWTKDIQRCYRSIMSDEDIGNHFFGTPRATVGMEQKFPLEDETVNLAIVSVLEAIDNFQQPHPSNPTPFAGGFTLTRSVDLALAAANYVTDEGYLSRPRRAWLMPLVVRGDDTGLVNWCKDNKVKWNENYGEPVGAHTLLAVIQEERTTKGATHFRVYFLDSCPRIFKLVRPYLYERIQRIAHCLTWSTHRAETGPQPQFTRFDVCRVPAQTPGGWQCGYHTIINAWIVALGLHPRLDVSYSDEIYTEAYWLFYAALAGILDWKTLAAWLITHHLVTKTSIENVPANRRFGFTWPQTDEEELSVRIRALYYPQDVELAAVPTAVLPYRHGNNFSPNTLVETGEHTGSLNRRVEDMDLRGLSRKTGAKRKARSDGLEFLGQPWKRQRVFGDALAFLDAY